ncbi:MAG TPA: hypothetical protein VG323_11665 [Thermoanaerobaculia bacterium]|nr:hypothetical protein [Thermoanaerobaculia bacterium]
MRRLTIPVFLLLASAAFAQKTETASATTTTTTIISSDSRQTHKEFTDLLRRLPSEVGVVLKLDPTLVNNQQYLATYPELAAFVGQHPDISHNPRFYLSDVYVPGDDRPRVRSQVVWDKIMEGFMILAIFSTIVGAMIWLIRTLIEQTRWSRVARAQNEVHGKLLDRLASNEELLRYMETPAGRRFLESAPLAVEGARVAGAPLGRILWSMQAGLVLAAAGIGLVIVSRGVDLDTSQPLYAMGIVGISVGIGFVLSAVISFVLSRRMKLLAPPETT